MSGIFGIFAFEVFFYALMGLLNKWEFSGLCPQLQVTSYKLQVAAALSRDIDLSRLKDAQVVNCMFSDAINRVSTTNIRNKICVNQRS